VKEYDFANCSDDVQKASSIVVINNQRTIQLQMRDNQRRMIAAVLLRGRD
jgi:hypothetical protein